MQPVTVDIFPGSSGGSQTTLIESFDVVPCGTSVVEDALGSVHIGVCQQLREQ